MKEEKVGVYLQISTKKGEYKIPFKSIEQLDAYTVQFEDQHDLITTLFGDLADMITDVEIMYVYNSKGQIIPERLPLKFYDDNFSVVDLKSVFHQHLETHPEDRLKKEWKVLYALTNGRIKNKQDPTAKNTSPKELAAAIDSVWQKGYKTKRDIYFSLKKLGYQVLINPTLTFVDRQPTVQERLTEMTPNSQYVEYLQGYAKQGKEEMALAMEQLSMFDLDDLLIMNAPMDASYNQMNGQLVSNPLDTLLVHAETLSPVKSASLAAEIYRLRDEFSATYRKTKCRK